MKNFKMNALLYIFFGFVFLHQFIQTDSQLLNYIIRLGNNPYRYNHFSINSEGDMVIDTVSYPLQKVRNFYGIKKDGSEFFTDKNGNKNYHSWKSVSGARVEGESIFIKIKSSNSNLNGNEYLFCISKYDNYATFKTEFFRFISPDTTTFSFNTESLFQKISSNVFSIVPDPKTEFYYFISFIATPSNNNNKFYTYKTNYYMNSDTNKGFDNQQLAEIDVVSQTIISCFFTDNYIYVCFYTNKDKKLVIWKYNPKTTVKTETVILTFSSEYQRRFYKGIYIKNDVGFFAYYENSEKYPTFSLYKINVAGQAEIYKNYEKIKASQGPYYNIDMLNDLIKLNENTICFTASSEDKKELIILVFSIYDDDNYMNIRYFSIDIWRENTIKFFCEIRLALYNNFLAMAFSNCDQENCNEDQYASYEHFSSLIFFNYPNSTNINFDIINYLFPDNKNIQNDIIINLESYLNIQNNLFGYVLKGTKIISYDNEILLEKEGNIIDFGTIINKGDNFQLKAKNPGYYASGNYRVVFAYILTEPEYGSSNEYMKYIDDSKGNRIKNEFDYYRNYEYEGKSSIFTAILTDTLLENCNEDICSLCYQENTDECVTCRFGYEINEETNKKICYNKNEQIHSSVPILNPLSTQIIESTVSSTESTVLSTQNTVSSTESAVSFNENKITEGIEEENISFNIITNIISTSDISTCTYDKIISGECNTKLDNEQIHYLYEKLKSKIKVNASELITTGNVIFQISSLHEQLSNNNPNVSSIDLGMCEKILKNISGLSDEEDLLVYKIDIKSSDLSKTYVQYEIYNPRNSTLLSLEACKNTKISIDVPLNLDQNTQSIYNSLSKSGYNLFNLNDDFYNDICSVYTTENGTDLTLADRKNKIYDTNGNITMCQDGCDFHFYNITTKKSQCDCSVQTTETITNIDEINFEKTNFGKEFFNTLNNSNFRVLKCFKLVFSSLGQKNNIGSYIMTGMTSMFLILVCIFVIKENSKIKKFIKSILKRKFDDNSKKEKKLKFSEDVKIFDRKNNLTQKMETIKSKTSTKSKKKSKNKIKRKKSKKSNKNMPPKRKNIINSQSDKNLMKKSFQESKSKYGKVTNEIKTENFLLKSNKKSPKTINIINIKSIQNNQSYGKIYTNKNIENIKDFLKENKMEDINDEQMNNLEYEIALIIDKRTYFQYYCSLLKKKHLFLFAFYPNNDYNLMTIKISLFILSFSLYFSINGFFFSDATMNKINEDHGKYDLLYEIPKMLYSTLITAVINIILKWFSLSEKTILIIKNEKNYNEAKKSSKSIKKCLKIKLTIFFILSLLLMLFFWYFISCFCAVYKNTQRILIIDTLISFAFTMIYPFGLNLLAGFFRIPALRAENKDKKCLYIFSRYIALI